MQVIDSDNYAGAGIDTFFFPGGEPHARVPKAFGDALLFLKARSWNDFGIGLCVLDALKRQGCGEVAVFCPYMPGARQDRSDGQTPLTAHLYLSALAMADYIYTFDAHSGLTERAVSCNYMPKDLGMPPLLQRTDYFIPIAPDAGAANRARYFSGTEWVIVQCEKKRDFASGKFLGFTMPPLTVRARYLIVDDICDGGGTFNLLAAEFDKDPIGVNCELDLWVSHGIFSRGVDAIHPRITHIYTTDSFTRSERNDPRLTVVPLLPVISNILGRFER